MTILFDQAKRLNALVLGTSNKTEILLGYSTVFGDNASSLNPLGDLYKHQVWQLSRHLGLPEQVVTRRPRPTSGPGRPTRGSSASRTARRTRCSTCSSTWASRRRRWSSAATKSGVVRRIVRLEQQFRFKRRLMLIARLSGSAINLDQEIPRD